MLKGFYGVQGLFRVFETMVVKIANSSSASWCVCGRRGSVMPQSSIKSSSQSCVSSASCNNTSSLEQNSASDRAREASLAWDATDVPALNIYFPKTATSNRCFGKSIKIRITADANPFVRRLISWLSLIIFQFFSVSVFQHLLYVLYLLAKFL